jgi:hypothetical protein
VFDPGAARGVFSLKRMHWNSAFVGYIKLKFIVNHLDLSLLQLLGKCSVP